MSGFSATKAVSTVSEAAAATTGVGLVPGALVTVAAAVYDTFSGILSGSIGGTSPRPSWDAAFKISYPTARDLTTIVVNQAGAENVSAIFDRYTSKLKSYISNSAHSDPQTRADYVSKIDLEAIKMGGGFRLDGFPFDAVNQQQLGTAIVLHALWLYGNVSKDEIENGNALQKFKESLEPTLSAAVLEVTGAGIDTATAALGTGGAVTPPPAVPAVKTAGFFSSPWVLVGLAGAGLAIVLSKKR